MGCDQIREALSARLDGEEPGLAAAVVDDHVAGCAACRAWLSGATALHRATRVREAEPVPDLTETILAATAPVTGRRFAAAAAPVSFARWALFTVALTQLVLAAPSLLGDDGGAAAHTVRELGAFDVAVAVGLLVAAWQPARAWGLLPVAAALAAVVAAVAVVDIVRGDASSLDETQHLLAIAGVALLWAVAREAARGQRLPLRARPV